jgi:hypothetical protein
VDIQTVACGGWPSLAPELVDELFAGGYAPGTKKKVSEQSARFRAAEGKRFTPLDRLDRAENLEFHVALRSVAWSASAQRDTIRSFV